MQSYPDKTHLPRDLYEKLSRDETSIVMKRRYLDEKWTAGSQHKV